MILLIATIIAVLTVSCCCSLAEAALFAVRMPYIRKDVLTRLARDEFDIALAELARPLHVVRDTTLAHELLLSFLHQQTYLIAVADAHGAALGVVALDDVFEAMLGRSIEDEKLKPS